MLPLVWSDEADADLDALMACIGQIDVGAAFRFWRLISASVQYLQEMYRQGERVPGCREIVAHPNYTVVYRVGLDCIEVLRVMHARQIYP